MLRTEVEDGVHYGIVPLLQYTDKTNGIRVVVWTAGPGAVVITDFEVDHAMGMEVH